MFFVNYLINEIKMSFEPFFNLKIVLKEFI